MAPKRTLKSTLRQGKGMRVAALAALAFLLVALAPAAPALHTGCAPSTSPATLTLGSGTRWSTTAYVVVDAPTSQAFFVPLPWIYMESNGRDGLQRQDEWRDDSCRGEYAADLLIF